LAKINPKFAAEMFGKLAAIQAGLTGESALDAIGMVAVEKLRGLVTVDQRAKWDAEMPALLPFKPRPKQ
jgi:hypothetical protein